MDYGYPDDDPQAFWRGVGLACALGSLAWLGAAFVAWRVLR